jgi:hypothetical protein
MVTVLFLSFSLLLREYSEKLKSKEERERTAKKRGESKEGGRK